MPAATSASSREQAGKPRAHYLHIGKTGGTAIIAALGPLTDAGPYEIVLDGHDVDLRQIPAGEKFFFVVRDPLERFVSAFCDRQRRSRPRYDVGWTLEEERAYGLFSTPDSLGCALSSPDEGLRAAAHEAMTSIYHVRHSYWHWFEDPEYFNSRLGDVLFIMWLPSLHSLFPQLCAILGLREAPELPSDDVGAHRNPGSGSRYLSDCATQNLEQWYKRDYEFVRICSKLDCAAPELRQLARARAPRFNARAWLRSRSRRREGSARG
ncbi:MAG TPA: sulfotransferase family 2 domain-containing protein [Solirubrobacteraceae bacterium]|nr:sulfotransferase family 2 domain-containing protein [Solirubrobacteraceae bacterium]